MKKLNQLLIIEADSTLEPLLSQFQHQLQLFSTTPAMVHALADVSKAVIASSPDLILFHSNLITMEHLRQFIQLQAALPCSNIIIVSNEQDEEISLLALEAGAQDSITKEHFTLHYMRKAALQSSRLNCVEKELSLNHEQLKACIENTPNVAVQWYNKNSEVLFWNNASERIFGWKAEEAIGKTVDQLITMPENRDFWLHKISHFQKGDAHYQPEEWAFHYRDGSEGCCISTFFPIPSSDTEPWFVCMDIEITERKQMEKDLKESEQRYHTLFNQAADAIFINDDKGCFLDVNERATELIGYTKEQLLKMKLPDIYSREELAAQPIMWKELLAGERTALERNLLHANGSNIPIEVTAQMFADGRVMAIIRNISERKKTEEALKQSEEKYRSLIEHQADAIAIFDTKGTILDVNTSATQMLQYTKEELRQMTLMNVLTKEELEAAPIRFDLLKNGDSTIKQRKMRRKDGDLVETEVHAKRLFDGMFIASVRDLTERIEVQRQLRKEREVSDSIINSLPGLFYLYKKDGSFLRWNKQFQKVSGYTAEEIKTMLPLHFFGSDEAAVVAAAIEKVFQTGQAAVEAHLVTKDAQRIPYYFTGCSIDYAGTQCLLGTAIDLSAIENLEKELSQQKIAGQKRLMQAMIDAEEKEKAKLGLELHDNISQILSVVRMYLAILNSNEVPEGVTLPKTIQLLNTAIEEIRSLSHRLAVSYKFEVGLSDALEEMVDKITLARDFSVDLQLPPALNEATNSHQKLALYRIVQEQLNNIIKYAKATEVAVQISLANDEIILTINDNGKGFDPLKVEKGLGLNTITNRTEALRGKVVIQSAPGKGCRIEAHIPLQAKTND